MKRHKSIFAWLKVESNQTFYYTRCITPKRVASFQAHFRVIAPAGDTAPFEEGCNDGEPLATLCLI